VTYGTLLDARELIPPPPNAIVHVESPGADPQVTRGLLRAGILPMEAAGRVPVGEATIAALETGRGEILYPRQWMYGFESLLMRLRQSWGRSPIRWTTDPDTIVLAFDKRACLERWEEAGLPTPRRWDGIDTWHQLRQRIPHSRSRVFVKLRHGYSAMGAVAIEWVRDRVRAITTVETAWSNGRLRLFVTRRPRVLTRELEISLLIDSLAMEEIVVEDWLSKARCDGVPFDLRLVWIAGRIRQVVGRARHSPFTNLNLDARRIGRDRVEQLLGHHWSEAETLACAAARTLPGASVLGIDLLVRPGFQKSVLLEANAFGDYLPGLLHEGRETYDIEVESQCERMSAAVEVL